MRIEQSCGVRRGLVLPMVVVLLAGLWLLCLSMLSLSAIGKRRSQLQIDRLQAELAMQAGFEDLKLRLLEAMVQDDFLVLEEQGAKAGEGSRLHLVTPSLDGDDITYLHRPMFSSLEGQVESNRLLPASRSEVGTARLRTHPWLDAVEVDWLPLHNEGGEMVARYAWWVEDLEARIDPSLDHAHIQLQAMDDSVGHHRTNQLLSQRDQMLSPDSVLAAAGVRPPLRRVNGRLEDPWEDFLERCTIAGLQSYEEQALVPFLEGIEPRMMGRSKLNLNRLLAGDSHHAVAEMADWIRMGLPEFEQRQGGFPDDYLETLAANAMDHADVDGEPLVLPGRYRGIDGQPFLSEVVLHLHFQGLVQEDGRWVMKWTLRLFAELWNMGSEPIESGQARLTYEVNLKPTAVGLGGVGRPFDSPALLEDGLQTSHSLERRDGRYVSPPVEVKLLPDEYRFHEFARVDYTIDCTPQLNASGQVLAEWFDLVELEHEARGLSLIWNGVEVERLSRIHRDPHGLANFRTDRTRKTAKACIPALNYGGYQVMINNAGDPRISHYLRQLPLGENAYPENLSPHRRNIRRRNIYDRDPSPAKTRHYGRVMPSQWPDGGHDSPTGDFRVTTSDARFPTDQEFWPLAGVPTPLAAHAPQRSSNRGIFLQVTELGRVHDPVMWTPAYPGLPGLAGSGSADTAELNGTVSFWKRPAMPLRRGRWPEVSWASLPSVVHGGGNSLRIGRPEHQRFDRPGMRASQLLDLFHCGQPRSEDPAQQVGPSLRVEGRVNVNTASREVLRCLAFGALSRDEALSRVIDPVHDTTHAFGPQLERWEASLEQRHHVADEIAGGIMRGRPFASPSEIAHIVDSSGQPLFGNPSLHAPDDELQWSDAAAEELFARVHAVSGVRSRNFRVWLVGQSVRRQGEGLEVKAVSKRVVSCFVDPGERGQNGEQSDGIRSEQQKVRVLHVRVF